jgi:3-hydroxy-9,10-secoandrosta-1,3,5(10)-triene-9,17-dione monooxygenase reductase component
MADAPSPTPAEFRRFMGRWATGVTVVTAHDGEVDAGLTVNAFLSVSLTPPSVLVSLTQEVDTLPVIERSGWFGVSFLAADQREWSERFARTDPPAAKFRGVGIHRAPHGSPLLDGTLGGLECRVVTRTPAQDHVLLIGEVGFLENGRDGLPLLYFQSAYAEPDPPHRLRLSAGRT